MTVVICLQRANITAMKTNVILGRRSSHATKRGYDVPSTGTERQLQLVGFSLFTCPFFLLLLLVQLSTSALLLNLLRTTLLRTFSGLVGLQVTHGGCNYTLALCSTPTIIWFSSCSGHPVWRHSEACYVSCPPTKIP